MIKICFCASQKFRPELEKFMADFQKIARKNQQSFVIFHKDGYIGANPHGELFAAAITRKLIFALQPKFLMGNYPKDMYEEPSASYLVHDIAKTPKELFEKIK